MAKKVFFDGIPDVRLEVGCPRKLVIPGFALCGKTHRTTTPEQALALSVAHANGYRLMSLEFQGERWVAKFSVKYSGFERRQIAEIDFVVAKERVE